MNINCYPKDEFDELNKKFEDYVTYLKRRNGALKKEMEKYDDCKYDNLDVLSQRFHMHFLKTPELQRNWESCIGSVKHQICERLNNSLKRNISRRPILKSTDIDNVINEENGSNSSPSTKTLDRNSSRNTL